MEDNSPVPDQPEDLLDKRVEEKKELSEATCQQVKTNNMILCVNGKLCSRMG